MQNYGLPSNFGLENHGLYNLGNVYWNLSPAALVEQTVRRGEAGLTVDGAVVGYTGQHTGRSPKDKYIVRHPGPKSDSIWWGPVNQSITPQQYQIIHSRLTAYLQGRDLFIQDMVAGAHPDYQLPIRVITEYAWHSLFAHNLFIRLPEQELAHHVPGFTVIQCPGFIADPEFDGTRSGTVIVVDFEDRMILIGNTGYAGEVKKSIFTVMNYLLPQQNVLSMHCSANVGKDGDVALFFGLSGTGKTTLSSDPDRRLIGDDEHGWSSDGVFNFEGGCYAKTIRLKPDLEPIIWSATHRFGTVLENVIVDETTHQADFDDACLTENTRAAYPIHYVPNHMDNGYAGHPENIFFLTADAFGVLPPIARLPPEQAMYYFLSGYTSKLAGTEKELGNEPEATFSTCFGAPFLPLHPRVYADLLGKKIEEHNVRVWLLNTGWTGGPFGVGSRFKLPYTRAMVKAALNNAFDTVTFHQDDFFGLSIPETCPGVPDEVLDPQQTWNDPLAYEQQAHNLIGLFEKNFEQFRERVDPGVISAGPQNR